MLFTMIGVYFFKDGPTIETGDVQIKETYSGTLDCKVSSKPESNITWERLDNTVDITKGLVKRENSLSLHFTAVTRNDTGRYKCLANNGIGGAVFTLANLSITCKLTFVLCDLLIH